MPSVSYESAMCYNDSTLLTSTASSMSSDADSTDLDGNFDSLLPFSPITTSDVDSACDSDQSNMDTSTVHECATSNDDALLNTSTAMVQPAPTCMPVTIPKSFKIVGDNIDVRIVPRYMRVDCKVQSIHYFHSYAVQDRIQLDRFPNERAPSCLPCPDDIAKSLLPTPADDEALIGHIKILFARVLVETLTWFDTCFSDIVVKHIYHRRYSEMSSKSIVVSYTVHVHVHACTPACLTRTTVDFA